MSPSPQRKKQRFSPEPTILYYKLQGTTGDPIKISQEAVRHMVTINEMISNTSITPETAEQAPPTPIGEVSDALLQKIVAWCEFHKEEKLKTNQELDKIYKIPHWDEQFLAEMSDEELILMIKAADYLNVGLLMTYVACKIASSTHGQDCEVTRKKFGIP